MRRTWSWGKPWDMGWLSRTLAPVVLCSTPVCGALAADRCAEVAGRVAAVEEQVEVASGGGWNVVGVGEPVCVGEVLRAGGGGRGAVILESGAVLRLDRGTTLRIERETADGSTLLRLLSGVASFFSRRPHALEVDTPFANAAVEGTEFAVAVDPDRARVTVLEGRVRFSNPQGAVGVDAGGSAVALAGKAPEIALSVRPRDAVRWALYYPALGEAALPADADPATREAARLAAEGRRAEALARVDAVPPTGRDPSYLTLRAGVLLGLGRGEEAGAALAEALARRPDDHEALALCAVLEVARNERGPALADARRAVAVAPDNPRARLALSYAAQADLDIPLARASLEAAV